MIDKLTLCSFDLKQILLEVVLLFFFYPFMPDDVWRLVWIYTVFLCPTKRRKRKWVKAFVFFSFAIVLMRKRELVALL